MYGLSLITPPASEPISLADAKAQCRVDSAITADDAYITALISAARVYAENFTGLSLLTQVWQMTLDHFPSAINSSGYSDSMYGWGASPAGWIAGYGRASQHYFANGIIQLPRNPVQSVAFIKYLDMDGVQQTLDPSLYVVSLARLVARLAPVPTGFWPLVRPSLISPALDVVTIEFTAGYEDAGSIPATIIQAIKLMIAHWYANREEVITGLRAAAVKVPSAAEMLLWQERILEAA